MKSHAIYVTGQSDTRGTPITGGGKKWLDLTIYVGSSASNSHILGEIEIRRKELNDKEVLFELSYKNKVIDEIIFNIKTKEFYARKQTESTTIQQ